MRFAGLLCEICKICRESKQAHKARRQEFYVWALQICRFVSHQSDPNYTIFPLNGTKSDLVDKYVEKFTCIEGDIHEAVRKKCQQERTFQWTYTTIAKYCWCLQDATSESPKVTRSYRAWGITNDKVWSSCTYLSNVFATLVSQSRRYRVESRPYDET